MRKPIEIDRFAHPSQKLSRLTDAQHDVFAVWQLPTLGISTDAARLRCRTGRTHRIHHGVYTVGSRRLTRFGRWMAAVLAHGPSAVLSHHAALALWGLRPYGRRAVDVTVPARGRRSSDRIAVHNVRALDPRDCTRREGIPVTTVARTLLDVAEIATPQELRHAVEAAERRELLDHARDRCADRPQPGPSRDPRAARRDRRPHRTDPVDALRARASVSGPRARGRVARTAVQRSRRGRARRRGVAACAPDRRTGQLGVSPRPGSVRVRSPPRRAAARSQLPVHPPDPAPAHRGPQDGDPASSGPCWAPHRERGAAGSAGRLTVIEELSALPRASA